MTKATGQSGSGKARPQHAKPGTLAGKDERSNPPKKAKPGRARAPVNPLSGKPGVETALNNTSISAQPGANTTSAEFMRIRRLLKEGQREFGADALAETQRFALVCRMDLAERLYEFSRSAGVSGREQEILQSCADLVSENNVDEAFRTYHLLEWPRANMSKTDYGALEARFINAKMAGIEHEIARILAEPAEQKRVRKFRRGDYPTQIERIIPVEARAPKVDDERKTGKTGAKDEGLLQRPQQQEPAKSAERLPTVRARTETTQRLTKALRPDELSEFLVHAAAHPWDSNSGMRPSDHIKTEFAKWLKLGLSRSDLVAAQPNLAQAYATETSRNPTRRIKGLVVRPHKIPPGAKPAISMRPVWQLTKKELEEKRALERAKKQRQRQRLKDAIFTPS